MGRETLHWFRLLTPGALAGFFVLTLAAPSLSLESIRKTFGEWEGLAIIVCLLIGYPYRVFDVRRLFLKDFWETVNSNIKESLLAIARKQRQLTTVQEAYLKDERRLMDVFYRIVDNDESLKAKATGIYLNGYLTTFGVDIVVVGSLAGIAHALAWVFWGNEVHLKWVAGCVAIALVAWFIFRKSVKRHLELSNEQLRFIGNFYADRVCESADSILRNMPAGTSQSP